MKQDNNFKRIGDGLTVSEVCKQQLEKVKPCAERFFENCRVEYSYPDATYLLYIGDVYRVAANVDWETYCLIRVFGIEPKIILVHLNLKEICDLIENRLCRSYNVSVFETTRFDI